MKELKLTYIQFQNKLTNYQLPLLRGAFMKRFEGNILFHNHLPNNFRYIYPFIQYKRINGYTGVVGINEGAEALSHFSAMSSMTCILGGQSYRLALQSFTTQIFNVEVTQSWSDYKIYGWLPLNQENYRKYQRLPLLSERIRMLERILTGNILSFAKGIDLYIGTTVTCELKAIRELRLSPYKGVDFMNFDASFRCNVSLPGYIGLGKGVSLSHGVVIPL